MKTKQNTKDLGTCFFSNSLCDTSNTKFWEEEKALEVCGVQDSTFLTSSQFIGDTACPYTIVFSSKILRDIYIILSFVFFFSPFLPPVLAFYPTITLSFFCVCAVLVDWIIVIWQATNIKQFNF